MHAAEHMCTQQVACRLVVWVAVHTWATSPAAPEIASMTVLLSRGLRRQSTSVQCVQTGVHAHTLWCVHDGANAPKLQQAVPVGCNCGHHRNSDSKLHRYSGLGERRQVQAMHPAPQPAPPPGCAAATPAAGCAGCLCREARVSLRAQMIQLDQVFAKGGLSTRRQAHSGFNAFLLKKMSCDDA